jgi:phospholipid/cholesterol/gamma-HCH transport system permease protein
MVVTEQIDALRVLAIDPLSVPHPARASSRWSSMLFVLDDLRRRARAPRRRLRGQGPPRRRARRHLLQRPASRPPRFGDVATASSRASSSAGHRALELPLRPRRQGRRAGRRPRRQRLGGRQRRGHLRPRLLRPRSPGHERNAEPATAERTRPSPPAWRLVATGRRLSTSSTAAASCTPSSPHALLHVPRPPRARRRAPRRCYEIGNRRSSSSRHHGLHRDDPGVPERASRRKRVVPDLTMLGATYLELLVRDLAASIGALMLATRVGAGIAAEIGSMVVTEQVDALRMCARRPHRYLIVPRFKASIVMTTRAHHLGAAREPSLAGGHGVLLLRRAPPAPSQRSSSTSGDVIIGLAKCVAYGAAIPIVSGLLRPRAPSAARRASAGPPRAPSSTARSPSSCSTSSSPSRSAQAGARRRLVRRSRRRGLLHHRRRRASGKSVLIKHLIGLSSPTRARSGSTAKTSQRLDEQRMYPVRKKCAMVFQHATLFDSMTCAENVALPLRKHRGLGLSRRSARSSRRARLAQVHMATSPTATPRARRRHAQARRHRARPHARPALRALRRAHHERSTR